MILKCQICQNETGNKTYVAREMMYGWRDQFAYVECFACGCLQLAEVPDDLSRYYGLDYYSVEPLRARTNALVARLKCVRTRAYLTGQGIVGGALLKAFGPPNLLSWARRAKLAQNSRILEVGCGTGSLLRSMQAEGFKDLTGIDPFIESDIDYGGGLRIIRTDLTEARGHFDFIVLEHAFEHIPDPHGTMAVLKGLLAPGGTLIIAIPLIGEAWKRYGVNWVQLDAPRHLFLHTERSFRYLAGTVFDVEYDSGAVQFWGSEQYQQDIPLLDQRSYRVNPARSMFTSADIARFKAQADGLNAQRLGDQATFYLSAQVK